MSIRKGIVSFTSSFMFRLIRRQITAQVQIYFTKSSTNYWNHIVS